MRKHKFVDKHPVLSSFLIFLLFLFAQEIIVGLLTLIHTSIFGPEISDLIRILHIIITAAILFFIYKWWFRPDFEGALKGGDLRNPLLYFVPLFIHWIISAIVMIIEHSFSFKGISLQIIRISLTAGLYEELWFRHAFVSTLLRNKNQKNQLYKIILISSLFFGFVHITNIFVGADPLSTINQVLTATCFGIYFAVVYMRCGNLLYPIILHTAHDIYAVSTSANVTTGGIIEGGLSLSSYADLICCILMAFYAIKYLLPEQEKEKVVALWNHKWNKDNIETTIE